MAEVRLLPQFILVEVGLLMICWLLVHLKLTNRIRRYPFRSTTAVDSQVPRFDLPDDCFFDAPLAIGDFAESLPSLAISR